MEQDHDIDEQLEGHHQSLLDDLRDVLDVEAGLREILEQRASKPGMLE